MVKKLLICSVVMVVAGLALIIFSDPQFRLIFSTSGTSGFPTTRSFTFNGTIPTGGFNRTTFPGAGGGAAFRGIGSSFNATAIIESLVGTGLIGVGVVLVLIDMFLGSSK